MKSKITQGKFSKFFTSTPWKEQKKVIRKAAELSNKDQREIMKSQKDKCPFPEGNVLCTNKKDTYHEWNVRYASCYYCGKSNVKSKFNKSQKDKDLDNLIKKIEELSGQAIELGSKDKDLKVLSDVNLIEHRKTITRYDIIQDILHLYQKIILLKLNREILALKYKKRCSEK